MSILRWPLFVLVGLILSSSCIGQDKSIGKQIDTEASPAPIQSYFSTPQPVVATNSSIGSDSLVLQFLSANSEPEGDMPRELAITPDGSTVLIVNRDTDNVSFLDVNAQLISTTIAVGDFPVDVEVTPDGEAAVVPNVFSNSVSVIDLDTLSVTEIPVTGEQPFRVAITSDSQFAVVGVINDGVNSSFSVINLDSNMEVASFPTVPQGVIGFFSTPEPGISGNIFSDFALSSDDMTLVVPDRGNDQVAIYDLQSGLELNLIPTADAPSSVDISADGTFAVVGHEGLADQISVVDLNTLTISNTLATPDTLRNQVIRISPDNQFAIGALLNEVVFVNLSNGASSIISTGTVGDIEFSFDDQYAFVANFNARIIDLGTQSLVNTIPFAPSYESVTSPIELRAIALNNRFREDAHIYNIDGAAGFFEGSVLSGELEEGDGTRTVAVTPNGRIAVAANVTSDNVTIFDACNFDVLGYAPTGERSLGIAVTPDGQTAVVCNAESNTTSIIDITTGTKLVDLPTSQRPAEVAVSPDGTMAYVTSVAGTDRIHFIELDGANSSVVSTLIAGQMGSITYTYGVLSGITVSPDGSTIAVCISFDDELLLIDAATMSEITRVPVGDFPIRVSFTEDSSFALVTNSFSDNVTVVEIDGNTSQVVATANGIPFPLDVVADSFGSFGYAASFDLNSPGILVFELLTGQIVGSVPLQDRPRRLIYDAFASNLIAVTTGGELITLEAAGGNTVITDSVDVTSGPSDLDFQNGVAVVAQPIPDGIDVVEQVLRGDVNLDGVIDLLDITPLVNLITSGSFQAEGDVNKDSIVDLLDVAPFVELLTGN